MEQAVAAYVVSLRDVLKVFDTLPFSSLKLGSVHEISENHSTIVFLTSLAVALVDCSERRQRIDDVYNSTKTTAVALFALSIVLLISVVLGITYFAYNAYNKAWKPGEEQNFAKSVFVAAAVLQMSILLVQLSTEYKRRVNDPNKTANVGDIDGRLSGMRNLLALLERYDSETLKGNFFMYMIHYTRARDGALKRYAGDNECYRYCIDNSVPNLCPTMTAIIPTACANVAPTPVEKACQARLQEALASPGVACSAGNMNHVVPCLRLTYDTLPDLRKAVDALDIRLARTSFVASYGRVSALLGSLSTDKKPQGGVASLVANVVDGLKPQHLAVFTGFEIALPNPSDVIGSLKKDPNSIERVLEAPGDFAAVDMLSGDIFRAGESLTIISTREKGATVVIPSHSPSRITIRFRVDAKALSSQLVSESSASAPVSSAIVVVLDTRPSTLRAVDERSFFDHVDLHQVDGDWVSLTSPVETLVRYRPSLVTEASSVFKEQLAERVATLVSTYLDGAPAAAAREIWSGVTASLDQSYAMLIKDAIGRVGKASTQDPAMSKFVATVGSMSREERAKFVDDVNTLRDTSAVLLHDYEGRATLDDIQSTMNFLWTLSIHSIIAIIGVFVCYMFFKRKEYIEAVSFLTGKTSSAGSSDSPRSAGVLQGGSPSHKKQKHTKQQSATNFNMHAKSENHHTTPGDINHEQDAPNATGAPTQGDANPPNEEAPIEASTDDQPLATNPTAKPSAGTDKNEQLAKSSSAPMEATNPKPEEAVKEITKLIIAISGIIIFCPGLLALVTYWHERAMYNEHVSLDNSRAARDLFDLAASTLENLTNSSPEGLSYLYTQLSDAQKSMTKCNVIQSPTPNSDSTFPTNQVMYHGAWIVVCVAVIAVIIFKIDLAGLVNKIRTFKALHEKLDGYESLSSGDNSYIDKEMKDDVENLIRIALAAAVFLFACYFAGVMSTTMSSYQAGALYTTVEFAKKSCVK